MDILLASPTKEQVKKARDLAGQTQDEAAKILHMANYKVWQNYELGNRAMSKSLWELYLIKTFGLTDVDYKKNLKNILEKLHQHPQ